MLIRGGARVAVISFVLFFQCVSSGFAAPSTGSGQAQVQTYDELVKAIREARAASQTRVEQAVEQERVREAWEIGKLIDTHVLQHKERADYGKQVLLRLANDLGMSETELGYMLQFVRAYPISRPAGKLSWSEYETLLAVNDSKERQTLVERTEKENWSRDQLRKEVRAVTQKDKGGLIPSPELKGSQAPLTAKPGKPGTYRIVKATVGPETGKVVIDLGFSNYYKTSKNLRFKEGAIIEAMPPFEGSSPSDLIRLSKRTPEDLYSYRAWVVNVLDGDTLKVVVDLGFGVRSVQTLRLRGIDAPEIVTADGKAAKEFVEKMLGISGNGERETQAKASVPILIKTVKSDKYDRYLADVFLVNEDNKEQYLNNALLEKGYAVRVQS